MKQILIRRVDFLKAVNWAESKLKTVKGYIRCIRVKINELNRACLLSIDDCREFLDEEENDMLDQFLKNNRH